MGEHPIGTLSQSGMSELHTVNVDHAAAATARVEQVAATVADADRPKGVSNDGAPTRLFEPPVLRELSCSERECVFFFSVVFNKTIK